MYLTQIILFLGFNQLRNSAYKYKAYFGIITCVNLYYLNINPLWITPAKL